MEKQEPRKLTETRKNGEKGKLIWKQRKQRKPLGDKEQTMKTQENTWKQGKPTENKKPRERNRNS